jgi:asparagine synthase (glutamine-hydrolysing)
MCGIFGSVALRGLPNRLSVKDIVNSNSKLKHRGPDDEGYTCFNTDGFEGFVHFSGNDTVKDIDFPSVHFSLEKSYDVMFAHRRLSIIDLSKNGHQPMILDDRFLITFNGEIYNFEKLRNQLISLGAKFITNSDTEVVLNAYKFWGTECLSKFIGMFSFVIFDKEESIFFAARDNFGIKPFYYLLDNNSIVFSSEVKAFMNGVTDKFTLNIEQALVYLKNGFIDGSSKTLINEVFELRAGEYLCFSINDIDIDFEPKQFYKVDLKSSSYVSLEALEELLQRSVDFHVISDVEVGVCLSGGLDSSLLAMMVARNNQLKVFSYVCSKPEFSEKKYIDILLNENANLQSNFLDDDSFNDWEALIKLVYTQDFPFASSSVMAQSMLFQLVASKGVKVVIDGQGADELFGGYSNFLSAAVADKIKERKFLAIFKFLKTLKRSGQLSVLYTIGLGFYKYLFYYNKLFRHFFLFLEKKRTFWLRSDFNKSLNIFSFDINHHSSILQYELQSAREKWSLPQLLRYEDRNSMNSSVESRVPFCNRDLFDYVSTLNDSCFVSEKGTTKSVLRQLAQKFVPSEIIYRKKIGFESDDKIILRDNFDALSKIVREVMSSTGLFAPSLLDYLEREIFASKSRREIWRIVNFCLWMSVYKVEIEK